MFYYNLRKFGNVLNKLIKKACGFFYILHFIMKFNNEVHRIYMKPALLEFSIYKQI